MPEPLSLDPRTTALVSIDMQNSVANHAAAPHPASDVVDRVAQLAESLRAAHGFVVFVRTSFLPDESDAVRPAIDAPRHIPEREAGWDRIVARLERRPNEPVVTKRSFNAFHASDLDHQLRRHGIRTVILAGISTNFGVEGTGRAAYDLGYDIVFAEDAMSASTAELHRASLTGALPYLGRIRPTAQIIAALEANRAAA
ncbi:isochorismatase family protein [Gryllotalpicola ginsengisoli]|uniref:isochorismatase family protein n=1 Tax=Gryllotalpicola ginsengisoli TaxID=444608 RepID=UPI0003B604ED|nr:isochorismatase family protein [Gryllotalpicola ginsengisoli]